MQTTVTSLKPRVLLVDNDERIRETYRILLKYWGYQPILAVGEGKALIRDAIVKAREACCILALIDLRLLDDSDDDDTSGLKLAQEIGPIRSIILSSYPNLKILSEMLNQQKDIPFLSKAASPEKMKQILDTEVSKVSAHKRGLKIRPGDLLDQIAQTTFASLIEECADQITDLFAQLFPGATNLRIEKLGASSFVTHASNVPRPSSVVLKVHEADLEPVVVKLARAEKIKIEVDQYEQFIFRRLHGSFIARLERHALLWDLGGAVYSYIGDFDVKTFSRYYEEHPIEDIQECLNSFFISSWGRHYEREQIKRNISLFNLYGSVWGKWYEKRVKNFVSRAALQIMDVNRNLGLPEPIEWFKKQIAENGEEDVSIVETTFTAITHGDLHGDNLLIDGRKNAWVIDFERTGEGHALQDFIELESDIINRLEAHNDFPSYYQLCQVVATQTQIKAFEKQEIESSDPSIRKALETISTLRLLALKCTGISDARQYVLGLLFNTIFRATIHNSENHSVRQSRALMLASLFCHRLDHWNEPWPPQEWKSVLPN